jgi:DNA-binding transcriptional MerR regulator
MSGADRFDDATYPAYSMGTAADLIGVEPAFLRTLGQEGLLTPHRSTGGHRRYSRDDLSLATRARAIVDEGHTVAAACRIVLLEHQLAQTRAELAELRRQNPYRRRGHADRHSTHGSAALDPPAHPASTAACSPLR